MSDSEESNAAPSNVLELDTAYTVPGPTVVIGQKAFNQMRDQLATLMDENMQLKRKIRVLEKNSGNAAGSGGSVGGAGGSSSQANGHHHVEKDGDQEADPRRRRVMEQARERDEAKRANERNKSEKRHERRRNDSPTNKGRARPERSRSRDRKNDRSDSSSSEDDERDKKRARKDSRKDDDKPATRNNKANRDSDDKSDGGDSDSDDDQQAFAPSCTMVLERLAEVFNKPVDANMAMDQKGI